MKGVASPALRAFRELDESTLELLALLSDVQSQEFITDDARVWTRLEALELVKLSGAPALVEITPRGLAVVALSRRPAKRSARARA